MERRYSNLLMDECPPDLRSPDDENNKLRSPQDPDKHLPDHRSTKGVAMSFGFKRRPNTAPPVPSSAAAARRLANADVDTNGNGATTTDAVPAKSTSTTSGRTTPKLAPPKKEASATRVSRFGFRQTTSNRQNKVADLNCPVEFSSQNKNNNLLMRPLPLNRAPTSAIGNDNHFRNNTMRVGTQSQVGRFTLQSTDLPRPEPIRLIETKTAKTLANNNRRVAEMYQQHREDSSSKDSSLTEDSGIGSHNNGLPGLEQLESSPTFGARRRGDVFKSRNLEVVVNGTKTFDVRDLNGSSNSCDSIGAPPLPQLPSAFNTSLQNRKNSYQTISIVQERTLEYQRRIDWDNRGRKMSVTSSEGFSDDYGEEEKTYKDIFKSEKTFVKPMPHTAFLKSRASQVKDDSSLASSDDQEWIHGGEAMADDVSFSLSSSDESKVKHAEEPISAAVIGSALQSLMSGSLSKAFTESASSEVKNVMLTIEDPKFAAVAAASNAGLLLDEEILLSPTHSLISCSESEETRGEKLQTSSSNSKDVNEKLTPTSPGTPTNTSNSLSLSDAKDDFLIDDEIADQPGLIFKEAPTQRSEIFSLSQNSSDTTLTFADTASKPRRNLTACFEGSPLRLRNKKSLMFSRTGSLDTLSPCESIASDDMMVDYDYSMSSGMEECDRQSSGFPSLNETVVAKPDTVESCSGPRDWNILGGSYTKPEKQRKSNGTRSRLLHSRAGTPSSISDSPRSVDSRVTRITRPSATSSPVKSRIGHLSSTGYDSDDSIRLDRASHTAIKQDIISIKTMLLKLRRVLNESETHNPFESQATVLTNGLFNSLCPSETDNSLSGSNESRTAIELAELRRQVLFLQGQLDDREKTVESLREQMVQLTNDNYHANSAPASTSFPDTQTCNAATQTERIRPISAGPCLLNGSPVDGSTGSFVSASDSASRRSCLPSQTDLSPASSKRTPSRLWRQPGNPPSPQRYANNSSSSIPKRARSRTRMPVPIT